jgi:hypothetical protein
MAMAHKIVLSEIGLIVSMLAVVALGLTISSQ